MNSIILKIVKLTLVKNKYIIKNLFYGLIILITYFPIISYSQQVAIAPLKMNVLYKFVPNPIKIVIEKNPCDSIIVNCKNGKLENYGNCRYTYYSKDCNAHYDTFFVGIRQYANIQCIDTVDFRLIDVYKDIIPHFNFYHGTCKVDKSFFTSCIPEISQEFFDIEQPYLISAPLINYDINLNFKITKFDLEIIHEDSILFQSIDNVDNIMTVHISQIFRSLQPGDFIKFSNIFIEYGDCEKLLENIEITIK